MSRINLARPTGAPAPADTTALARAVLILILGSIVFSISQLVDSERQSADLRHSLDQIRPQVQAAQYQEAKLHGLVEDVLDLSSTDPVAAQIVARYKIHRQTPSSSVETDRSAP